MKKDCGYVIDSQSAFVAIDSRGDSETHRGDRVKGLSEKNELGQGGLTLHGHFEWFLVGSQSSTNLRP